MPSGWQSNIRPTSRRVLAAITTSPRADAAACKQRRHVWRLADRNALSSVAGPQRLPDNNQPRGDADARLKGHSGSDLRPADRVEDGKAGAHGLLGVMLMSRRVAKIDEHAIARYWAINPSNRDTTSATPL